MDKCLKLHAADEALSKAQCELLELFELTVSTAANSSVDNTVRTCMISYRKAIDVMDEITKARLELAPVIRDSKVEDSKAEEGK